MGRSDKSRGERSVAIAALLLLAVLVAAEVAVGSSTIFMPLLVVAPLLAAVACPPRFVAIVGALAVLVAVPLGAADDIFGSTRHLIYLGVLVAGAAFAVALARTRTQLVSLR